jgi:hypothetical protein
MRVSPERDVNTNVDIYIFIIFEEYIQMKELIQS